MSLHIKTMGRATWQYDTSKWYFGLVRQTIAETVVQREGLQVSKSPSVEAKNSSKSGKDRLRPTTLFFEVKMTEEMMAQIKALATSANSRPWALDHDDTAIDGPDAADWVMFPLEHEDIEQYVDVEQRQANCKFIIATANGVLDLIVEVRRLRGALQEIRDLFTTSNADDYSPGMDRIAEKALLR